MAIKWRKMDQRKVDLPCEFKRADVLIDALHYAVKFEYINIHFTMPFEYQNTQRTASVFIFAQQNC